MSKKLILFVLFVFFSGASAAAELQGVEPRLIHAMNNINNERIDDALSDVKDLLKKTPQFDLAQLLYADLLMAKAGLPGQFGFPKMVGGNEKVRSLRDEARVRWLRYQEKHDHTLLPDVLMQMSTQQKNAVIADLSRSRLYLYENHDDGPRLLADFYVTQGKNGKGKNIEGDSKTPLGTYFVTSSLDTSKLPDLYGSGAFPIDYPNAWDRRAGKTGHGIWLHGVPSDTYSRVPLDTRGCLAMNNEELDSIKPFLQSGVTPVIITSQVNWVKASQLQADVANIKQQFERWRLDWQSRDMDAYMQHYSRAFRSESKDYRTWDAHKRRVNKHKQFIEVNLSNVSIFRYPDQDDMLVISYRQDYRSSNFNGASSKRQYWKKEIDGRWRIIYEGRG